MAEKKFLADINLLQNQLIFPRIHSLGVAPTSPSPVAGQMYYNTGDNILYVYNNTAWINALGADVPTALSIGTVTSTSVAITSDGSVDDVVIAQASGSVAGLLSAEKWDEIVENTTKDTNVPTVLSIGTITGTTYGITSDGGADDLVLPSANTTQAGLLSAAKWNEIVANTLKTKTSDFTNDGENGINPFITDLDLPVAAQTQKSVISVQWTGGLSFDVIADKYFILNEEYNATPTTITLNAADGSNDRIDLIVANTSGVITKITGTPSGAPIEPDYNLGTEIPLRFVMVQTLATTPVDPNTGDAFAANLVYGENTGEPTEFSVIARSGVNYADGVTFHSGTLSTEISNINTNNYATWYWNTDEGFQYSLVTNISFWVKLSVADTSALSCGVYLTQSGVGGGQTWAGVNLADHGFNVGSTSWQQVVIDISKFPVVAAVQYIDHISIQFYGTASGTLKINLDDIYVNDGSAPIAPSGGGSEETPTLHAVAVKGPITTVQLESSGFKTTGGLNTDITRGDGSLDDLETAIKAVGAVMEDDSTTASMGFVLDEDDLNSDSATKLATQQSIRAFVEASVAAAVVGGVFYQGSYDASLAPPTGVEILKGFMYTVSTAGNGSGFFAEPLQVGDTIFAEQDNPTLDAHWTQVNKNIPDIVDATITTKGIVELATQAEVDARTDSTRVVTSNTLASLPRKYAESIGDGGSTSIAVTHNLGTKDTTTEVYRVAAPYDIVEPEVVKTSTNVTTFNFNTAPASGQYRIVIIG